MNASSRNRLRLGNYEPLLELASGGMATVYVARQVGAAGFERLVVIKRVHRHHLGNREFYQMFIDEARVASMIHHPNVVAVIDVIEDSASASRPGTGQGELFLVMEYVESIALSSLLSAASKEGERLSPAIACRILLDTLAGLHAAHEASDMRGAPLEVVHRDVSPQNIIVGADGTSRLIDFGVAKAAHRLTETKSGSLKGKIAYMSPEQAMGMPVDRRVDLFAAGVALHEALTAKRLFHGENDFDTMRRVAEMPIPDPSSIAPGISPALDLVLARALQREPKDRFQTAADFLDALEAAQRPASPREVAAYVGLRCGERIAERRVKLRAILDGQSEPLSLEAHPETSDVHSIHTGSLASTVSPASARRRHEIGSEPRIEQESQVASQVIAAAPVRSLRRYAAGVGVVLVAAAITVVAVGPPRPRPVAVTTTPSAPTTETIAVSDLPVVPGPIVVRGEVELTLLADEPILSARAPGMRKVEIAGTRAYLTVATWDGGLAVDAVLEGNRPGHATAEWAGSREIKLALATQGAPPRAIPVPRPPPAHKAVPVAPGPNRPELQDNPYPTK